MNIYLTSYGLDTRYKDYMNSYKDIINLLQNKKVAIIPNAKLINEDRTNSQIAHDELLKNNIQSEIIDLDKNRLIIEKYDVLYLSGGEPKNLMDSIIRNNQYEIIKEFIDNGGIVIGQSAGAMIFHKEYLDTTTGKLRIMRNGFGYCNKIIVPHYDNLSSELLAEIPKVILAVNDNDRLYKIV
ncbi:MAG: Type 1 glutamine amidotransferase-like domain-containing protein [Firmicutes bacterium]|nr:Type 1 glutamine amidotransferase-like domain-containing protein [Bacillota bacterium]